MATSEMAAFEAALPAPRDAAGHRPLLLRARDEALLITVAAVFALFCAILAGAATKPDTWLSFVGGREIADHGLPHADPLALMSHGRQWIDQQWLAQLSLYGLMRVGGVPLAIVTSTAIQLAALILAFRFARRRGAAPTSIA